MIQHRIRKLLENIESESGQVLLLVLLLVLLGGLVLPHLLSLSITGLQAGMVYEDKTRDMYATDSGLEHALWHIKYGDLSEVLTSPAYDVYDYNTTWSYNLPEQLNNRDVTVSVDNVWVPMGITVPGKVEAQNIIEFGKLVVFTTVPDTATCQLEVIFYHDPGDELEIETMGLWLSPGFEYVTDSSSFGEPTIQSHAGGQAILWDFDGTPFVDFPGVDSESVVLRSEITVQYTSTHEATIPETVSWITTSGVSDVSYTWDADSRVYHTTAVAGNTRVETYNVKSEMRKLGASIEGDYVAIGNTLLEATSNPSYRNRLHEESSAIVEQDDIPANAKIEAAYLYWA